MLWIAVQPGSVLFCSQVPLHSAQHPVLAPGPLHSLVLPALNIFPSRRAVRVQELLLQQGPK